MGKVISKVLGLILVALQLIVSAVFCGFLYVSNFLTVDWMLIVVLILLILVLINLIMQRWIVSGIIGKILAIAVILVLGYGCNILLHTNSTLSDITDGSVQVDEIQIYVMQEDPAQSLADAKEYTFGILGSMDRENTDYAIRNAEDTIGSTLATKEYDDLVSMAAGLYSGEVGAIVMNQAYVDVLEDNDDYSKFGSETRVLTTFSKETEIVSAEEFLPADKICTTPFTLYISGCDQSGGISTKGRSDVNIIATVNPNTKQVLLVSTPRDYFVPLSISGGQKDKLTHAGIYGVDVSMDTLGMLYDTDLSLYFKVNFTGFKEIIDALGGIEVESDVAFTAGADASSQSDQASYSFTEGTNKLDGGAALAFARERHAFANGDRQRGINQMKVIEGVLKKLQSTALLTNYAEVMDSVADSFETNLTSKQIQALVKMQLNDMSSWNIKSYSVTGSDAHDYPYSSPSHKAYVMIPDETTVAKACELVDMVCEGEELTDADIKGE